MDLIARYRDREEKLHLERRDDGGYRVTVGESVYEVDAAAAGRTLSLRLGDGRQLEVAVQPIRNQGASVYRVSGRERAETVELMDPLTHLLEQTHGPVAAAGRVEALMPGRVVEILAHEGDSVEVGQGVVVVEAMKMKNEIQAEATGEVKRLFVQEGQNVEGGDPLFEIG